MLTAYAECIAKGLNVDHHESDMYVQDTRVARMILQRHGKTFYPFVSHLDGFRWLDVPFAYDPFWQKRQA